MTMTASSDYQYFWVKFGRYYHFKNTMILFLRVKSKPLDDVNGYVKERCMFN